MTNAHAEGIIRQLVKQGVGSDVTGAMTAEEALKGAGLDWQVRKVPIAHYTKNNGWWPIPDQFAIVRDAYQGEDSALEIPLGVVGSVYRPLQNVDAFRFFDAMVQEKRAIYRGAGQFKSGRRVWILAQIPQELGVGPDTLSPFIILNNSHDGGTCVSITQIIYRQVCTNGMMGFSSGKSFNFRHTINMAKSVDEARKAMGIIYRSLTDIMVEAQALVNKKSTAEMVEKLLIAIGKGKVNDETAPNAVKQRREDERLGIMRLMESGAGNDNQEIKGTLWSALNGITEWVDHVWERRSAENATMSNWFGTGAQMKQDAMHVALQLAKSTY